MKWDVTYFVLNRGRCRGGGFGSEVKTKVFCTFVLYFAHLALTLLREVRLRFGSKNESFLHFRFVLRSPCTNFSSSS